MGPRLWTGGISLKATIVIWSTERVNTLSVSHKYCLNRAKPCDSPPENGKAVLRSIDCSENRVGLI
ncbi:hypothetical protein E2C01_033634 [Portunus trituberculatus]|uniref:Uncharacterized protein n=1 Tax=Portunus trituberculatus TaxID=210409 RepID=A0A5B7EZC6_PORTR|nr:hypothetical protein [Portunus trituberculatus]